MKLSRKKAQRSEPDLVPSNMFLARERGISEYFNTRLAMVIGSFVPRILVTLATEEIGPTSQYGRLKIALKARE